MGLGLKRPGMEFASEMVVKAPLFGLTIAETPTTLKPDGRSRPPHLKTWRDGWRHLRFLLQHSPKWLFTYPGLVLLTAGVVGAAALSRGPVHVTPAIELDVHTLVAACFAMLIGVQMLMFGALARRYSIIEGFLPTPKKGEPLPARLHAGDGVARRPGSVRAGYGRGRLGRDPLG